jgi:UDP-2,3-diacylglucosamine pyrophosphatase LpxH
MSEASTAPENSQEKAKHVFTAVISDLHLCEAEPVNPDIPLWKKFKTKEFFFDDIFADFLTEIEEKAKLKSSELNCDHHVELVLNGDIFDFDSVTKLPEDPPYKITWLEKSRGLFPEEPKSVFKIQCILEDHHHFVDALSHFIKKGNSVVFIVGNHDVELLFHKVQEEIVRSLNLCANDKERVRFCQWFYISNKDTLIEHGHQYDPYCVVQNPIHPLVRQFNRVELRVPFGNLASRYMINGMGFFNPHVDSNYIMSIKEYVVFFFKYMAKAQPLLMWTWLWSANATFFKAFADRLLPPMKDPLTTEPLIEDIAKKANATPRMVRELNEVKVHPASSNPFLLAKELWLDRAFLIFAAFLIVFQIFTIIKLNYDISFFWMFIPLALCIPFFMFYTNSFRSAVHSYKEPKEKILNLCSFICGVSRIIYGHTHIIRHEYIGLVEHLNPGTWSPAFEDVECTKMYSKRMYCWLEPTAKEGHREASLIEMKAKD